MNEDFQYALVGDLLAGGETRRKTLELIEKHAFKPEYVTVPELKTVYDSLVGSTTDDSVILHHDALKKTSVETLKKAAEKGAFSLIDIERHVKEVKDEAFVDRLRNLFDEILRQKVTGEDRVVNATREMNNFAREVMSTAKAGGFSLRGVVLPPEEDDPDCLFRGSFLEKGGALVLGSVTGAGKSTLLMQLAFAWALGRPAFGIEPYRPIKIAVFQSENSLRDMVRISKDMREGYVRFNMGWTYEDCDRALDNIRFFDAQGKTDKEFLTMLYKEQFAGKFDLVIIDPLTGFATFDISDNTKMTNYLTTQIDPIIKVDPETKCALMIVHHTNKMSSVNAVDYSNDQYAQYICAGAAKLPNWARAIIGIMPIKDRAEHYYFVAAKNGEHLGWPPLVTGKKTATKPTKIIRHSTPEEGVGFWHEVSAENVPCGKKGKPSVKEDASKLAGLVQQNARTLTETRKLSYDLFKRKRGDAVYEELIDNLSDYNVKIQQTGNANKSVIGSNESLKNWFCMEEEKEAEKMRLKLAKMGERK